MKSYANGENSGDMRTYNKTYDSETLIPTIKPLEK